MSGSSQIPISIALCAHCTVPEARREKRERKMGTEEKIRKRRRWERSKRKTGSERRRERGIRSKNGDGEREKKKL